MFCFYDDMGQGSERALRWSEPGGGKCIYPVYNRECRLITGPARDLLSPSASMRCEGHSVTSKA